MILVPTPHQEAAIQRMVNEHTRAALNGSDVGVGKTIQAVESIKRIGNAVNLVTAPLHTRDGWEHTFESQQAGELRWVNNKNVSGKNAWSDLKFGAPGNYFMGREFARLQNWSDIHVGTLVADECFVAGTLISTPNGPRPIETLKVGDTVYGYDHESGEVIESRIEETMTRESDRIYGGATPNHPYYVAGYGYVPVADITEEDFVYELEEGPHHQAVRMVRAAIQRPDQEQQEEVLQQDVRGRKHSPLRPDEYGISGKNQKEDDREQPRGRPRTSPKDGRGAQKEPRQLEESDWRKRHGRDAGGVVDVGRAGLADLGGGQNRQAGWVSVPLQDRCSFGSTEDRGGMRWAESSIESAQGAGQEEGGVIEFAGVDHLAVLEPRNRERYRVLSEKSRTSNPVKVYNVGTTSRNYFAGGILVHNCHTLTDPKSRGFRAYSHRTRNNQAQWMNTDFRILQSATWFGSSFDGAWAIARLLWPQFDGYREIADASRYRWIDRWCRTEYDHFAPMNKKVLGEKNPGEFVDALPCYVKIASDLPELEPIEIRYQLTPVQRRLYKQMEEESLVWLREHPLTAELDVTRRIRLREIALAEPVLDENGSIQFPHDAKSALLDTVRDMLGDLLGEQILMGTHSAKFARFVASKIPDTFGWTGDASGEQRAGAKEQFIAGNLRNIVATQPAIAEGVDGLDRASHIMFELSLNDDPILNEQFRGRLRRRNQSKPVLCYRFVAEGTLDDPQHESLLKKELAMRASMK